MQGLIHAEPCLEDGPALQVRKGGRPYNDQGARQKEQHHDHPYTHFSDLAKEVQPPDKGILSRSLFSDDRLKAVLFGFGQGEELSEHTASMPAILHFLQGEAKLTLGDHTLEAKSGTWVHIPTGLHHSIQAKTPVVMLLLVVKPPAAPTTVK